MLRNMADASKKHAFMSIQLRGSDDNLILKNFKEVQGEFADPSIDVKLAGLLPLANELTGTIATDQQRAGSARPAAGGGFAVLRVRRRGRRVP